VESDIGKLTVFKLYFPVTREQDTEYGPNKNSADYLGNGESILVVDDVKEQREIASKILSQLGYSVKTAESGEQALELLKRNPVDLVVLDMIMVPGIDGLETYERIIELHPKQKAIIASGYSETGWGPEDMLKNPIRSGKSDWRSRANWQNKKKQLNHPTRMNPLY
jgi:CheY-like chemotaxis protein